LEPQALKTDFKHKGLERENVIDIELLRLREAPTNNQRLGGIYYHACCCAEKV
jgi:hypothetical protein